MTRAHHLVTGATGFIGAALVLELLDRTTGDITCLARPRPGQSADDRVRSALHRAATLFGMEHLASQINLRCRGVEGNVARPGCGLDPAGLGRVDEVWHLAALLAFGDERREDLLSHNVQGTVHAADLARRTSVSCFNYVSTAYVAGRRCGRIPEEPARPDTQFSNWYERSKALGEDAIAGSGLECVRILRPSMVIGHSITRATSSEGAIYGGARNLLAARTWLTMTVGDVLATRTWRLNGDARATLNVIPVDRVCAAAVRLALTGAGPGVYHLANRWNLTLSDLVGAICDVTGLTEPHYAADDSGFTLVDRLIDQNIGVYRPYTHGTKEFAIGNVDRILDRAVLDFPVSRPVIADFLRHYLNLQATVQAASR